MKVTSLTLDVLKPHEPSIIDIAKILCKKFANIKNVIIDVREVDKRTEDVKIIVEGKDLNYSKIKDVIEGESAAVHSIDGVIVENK